ncbi:hypothetical protein ADS78_13010, partial [Idiomarina abyssalis]
LIPGHSMISGMYLLQPMKRKFVAIKRAVSALMLKAGVVKHVAETGSSRSKCTSFQMCTFHVKFVTGNDTTGKHLK